MKLLYSIAVMVNNRFNCKQLYIVIRKYVYKIIYSNNE